MAAFVALAGPAQCIWAYVMSGAPHKYHHYSGAATCPAVAAYGTGCAALASEMSCGRRPGAASGVDLMLRPEGRAHRTPSLPRRRRKPSRDRAPGAHPPRAAKLQLGRHHRHQVTAAAAPGGGVRGSRP
eukprot:scaffold2030_cov388-Prasinococcus_capsulatus_cf.AAC.2